MLGKAFGAGMQLDIEDAYGYFRDRNSKVFDFDPSGGPSPLARVVSCDLIRLTTAEADRRVNRIGRPEQAEPGLAGQIS